MLVHLFPVVKRLVAQLAMVRILLAANKMLEQLPWGLAIWIVPMQNRTELIQTRGRIVLRHTFEV